MALENFIKTVWTANIMESLKKALVYGSFANTSYQGDLKQYGDKARIMQIGDININAYAKDTNLTAQDLQDAASEITIDQPYYFNFKANDIEAVQEKPALLRLATDNAAYGFRDKVDQYFAGLYADAAYTSYSSGTTCWDVTSANVEDVFLDAAEKMDNANIPREGRFAVIPPWVHTKLVLAGIAGKTQNDELFANGKIGRVLGFDMAISNNVSKNSAAWEDTRIICGIANQSFSFADVVANIEAYRPEDRFEDAVKGLYVFGGKIMRPDMTLCIHADKTAES